MIKKFPGKVNENGLSLVETSVALFILAVITVTLLNFFRVGNLFTSTACCDLAALNLAQQKLEEIKAMPYDDVANENEQTGLYRCRVLVQGNSSDLKTVTVIVSYQEQGRAGEVSLTTDKSRR